MKHALFTALGALALASPTWATINRIAPEEAVPKFAGQTIINYRTGQVSQKAPSASLTGAVVYDDTTNIVGGTADANPATVWGDDLNMTGTGVMSAVTFSVYNSTSGGNTQPMTSADVAIDLFRQSDSSSIGGFTANLDFTADPLPAGYYSLISFTDIDSLGINVDTPDVIIIQQLANVTGGTTRMGVIIADPPTIGASTDAFYVDNGANPGWYSFGGNPKANLAYEVEVLPEPASIALFGMIGAAGLLRRR